MKLKNFMFATMIACAFASCSEDDVPTPGTEPVVEADATLSLQVLGSVDTKSNPFSGVTDSTITSLTAYVFRIGANGGYVFETSQPAKSDEISGKKVEKIPVAAGMKKVIVLANATAANLTVGTSTLADLCDQNLTYSTAKANGLSMNSAVYDLYVKAGNENCLGYGANKPSGAIDATQGESSTTPVATSPIYLYRNVAKVMLSSVAIKTDAGAKYPNAALQIDSVYILHARKHSKIAYNNTTSGQGWGPTAVTVTGVANYLNGVSGESYLKWANFMTGKDKVKDYFTTAANYEAGAIASLGDAVSGFTATKTKPVSKVDSFYVYENPAVQGGDTTLLVVVGKFYPDGNTNATNVDYSYYTIGVGTDGLNANGVAKPAGAKVDRDVAGVLRNLEYKISLTVNGPGYETPFGPKLDDYTFLDVQCVVAPFGSVDQSWEI